MHYFLGSTGLGRTSVGRDLSVRGSGRVCSGSAGCRTRCASIGILDPQSAVPPGSELHWRGYVYRQAPKVPLFLGMSTSSRHFWAAGRVWATALCLDPPKKELFAPLVWLMVHATNIDKRTHYSLGGTELRRTSVGRVLSECGSDRVCSGCRGSWSRCASTGNLEPQETSAQILNILGGARIITSRLRCPCLEECPRASSIFGAAGHVCITSLAPRTTSKSPCATLFRLLGRATDNDNLQASWQYRKDIRNCCITSEFRIFVLLL